MTRAELINLCGEVTDMWERLRNLAEMRDPEWPIIAAEYLKKEALLATELGLEYAAPTPARAKRRPGKSAPNRIRNEEILQRFEAGVGATALAVEYGMTHSGIYYAMKKAREQRGTEPTVEKAKKAAPLQKKSSGRSCIDCKFHRKRDEGDELHVDCKRGHFSGKSLADAAEQRLSDCEDGVAVSNRGTS